MKQQVQHVTPVITTERSSPSLPYTAWASVVRPNPWRSAWPRPGYVQVASNLTQPVVQSQRTQVPRGSQVSGSEKLYHTWKLHEIATSTSELVYDFTTARPLDCIFSGMLEALAATCSDLHNALIHSMRMTYNESKMTTYYISAHITCNKVQYTHHWHSNQQK